MQPDFSEWVRLPWLDDAHSDGAACSVSRVSHESYFCFSTNVKIHTDSATSLLFPLGWNRILTANISNNCCWFLLLLDYCWQIGIPAFVVELAERNLSAEMPKIRSVYLSKASGAPVVAVINPPFTEAVMFSSLNRKMLLNSRNLSAFLCTFELRAVLGFA